MTKISTRGSPSFRPMCRPAYSVRSPPDIRKADGDGPHGLNAGVIQEWTWETTMLSVLLAYVLCFPVAFVILWRSRRVPRNHKIVLTALLLAGLVWVGIQFIPLAL